MHIYIYILIISYELISCNSRERNLNVFNIAMTLNASTVLQEAISIVQKRCLCMGRQGGCIFCTLQQCEDNIAYDLTFSFVTVLEPWIWMNFYRHVVRCGTNCAAPSVATDGTTQTDGMKWTEDDRIAMRCIDLPVLLKLESVGRCLIQLQKLQTSLYILCDYTQYTKISSLFNLLHMRRSCHTRVKRALWQPRWPSLRNTLRSKQQRQQLCTTTVPELGESSASLGESWPIRRWSFGMFVFAVVMRSRYQLMFICENLVL